MKLTVVLHSLGLNISVFDLPKTIIPADTYVETEVLTTTVVAPRGLSARLQTSARRTPRRCPMFYPGLSSLSLIN
jgi:hypothetical protein